MTGTQVKSIMMGSVLIIGGVVLFGSNRRKKLLFQAITDTIDERGGTWQGDDVLDMGADTKACKLTNRESTKIAKRVYSSLYDQTLFGWGTDENELFSALRSIPSRVCLSKVIKSYDSEYDRDMDANIRNDIDGDELDAYIKIVTQELR